jgi:hypothetical protein
MKLEKEKGTPPLSLFLPHFRPASLFFHPTRSPSPLPLLGRPSRARRPLLLSPSLSLTDQPGPPVSSFPNFLLRSRAHRLGETAALRPLALWERPPPPRPLQRSPEPSRPLSHHFPSISPSLVREKGAAVTTGLHQAREPPLFVVHHLCFVLAPIEAVVSSALTSSSFLCSQFLKLWTFVACPRSLR